MFDSKNSKNSLTNPVLKQADFEVISYGDDIMTMKGTIHKSFFLLLLTFIGAIYTWSAAKSGYSIGGYTSFGAIIGFVLALVTTFKQSWSPVTAPFYALTEGLFLGGISALYEARSHGIAIQAIMLTFGVFAGMLFLFQTRILRATPLFIKIIVTASVGIMISYLLGFIFSLFHITLPIFSSGLLGTIFSLIVVLVAAFSLIIDFEYIEISADSASAPKYMEWYSAFGLIVTIIWLYISLLQLLNNIFNSDSR